MHFEGAEHFHYPSEFIIAYLGNVGQVAKSLKDAELTHAEAERASWRVQPKFAFMAGKLNTFAEIQERHHDAIMISIQSTGVGCSSHMLVHLRFSAVDEGNCVVYWRGNLTELTGILKLVPRGMLQVAALKVITDVWSSIRSQLAAPKPLV